MLDFPTQKRILDPILKNPKNYLCADCDTISPTWASLDFGVFLCSNCSGAHRALGPTITRVRSANLDIWQNEWVNNMLIGNEEINKYWESHPSVSMRKPKVGATLNEIARYVKEKYVNKKYVADPSAVDPLTSYKNGTLEISKPPSPKACQPKPTKTQVTEIKKETAPVAAKPKVEVSLLEFDFEVTPKVQTAPVPQVQPKMAPQVPHHDDDEFTDFTQAGSTTKDHVAKDDLISFDALLTQHKQPSPPTHSYQTYQDLKSQNIHLHHPYNPMLGQQNLVYNAQFHPQTQHAHQYNQFHHSYTPNINHNFAFSGGMYGHHSAGYSNQVGVGNYWK